MSTKMKLIFASVLSILAMAHADGPSGDQCVVLFTQDVGDYVDYPVSQSSNYSPGHNDAFRAIDGNYNGHWVEDVSNSVSHTDNSVEGQHWWKVDLEGGAGTTVAVTRITVHNRQDCCWSRLEGATVHLLDSNGNDLQQQNDINVLAGQQAPQTILFGGGISNVAKVLIQLTPSKGDQYLQLTEVDIYGYMPGKGTGGDPHFTTWNNEHFEYHGQCDLTLIKDAHFAEELGLDIQIRTQVVRFWSYIKSVAIKIGDDILEIEGSADADDAEAHYWINYESQGDLDTFAGFPVTQKSPSVYKRQYIIDLSSKYPGASIVVQLYKEFVRVKFNGGRSVFGNTVGLLGDYKTGKLLARDGSTVMNDFAEFGDEWQVLPSEPKLFREAARPQFPELCIKPEDPRGERKRRLAESNISIEEAEVACATLKDPLAMKDCVYDILATQDLGMVGAF